MRTFDVGEHGWKPVAVTVGLPLMLASATPADASAVVNRDNRPALEQLSSEELRHVHARGVEENVVRALETVEQENGDIKIENLRSSSSKGIVTLTRRVQEHLPNRFRRMVQFAQVELLERELRTGFRLNDLLSVDNLRTLVKGVSRTVEALTQSRFRSLSEQSGKSE